MKRFITMISVLSLTLLFTGCKTDVVLDKVIEYSVESDIHSLEVRINAADFVIEQADAFSVESNLKYLTVSEKNGVLTIIEDVKNAKEYNDAVLTLYIPGGTEFEDADITTGAGRLTADVLTAKTLKLKLGAGEVRIERLAAVSEADIEGGAGAITVADGTLRDLELEMGAGEVNLTAALLGDCELTFGVGESNLNLLGDQDDYRVDVEKGLGGITVDGKAVSAQGAIGSGLNRVKVRGGIGGINLQFE